MIFSVICPPVEVSSPISKYSYRSIPFKLYFVPIFFHSPGVSPTILTEAGSAEVIPDKNF